MKYVTFSSGFFYSILPWEMSYTRVWLFAFDLILLPSTLFEVCLLIVCGLQRRGRWSCLVGLCITLKYVFAHRPLCEHYASHLCSFVDLLALMDNRWPLLLLNDPIFGLISGSRDVPPVVIIVTLTEWLVSVFASCRRLHSLVYIQSAQIFDNNRSIGFVFDDARRWVSSYGTSRMCVMFSKTIII